MKRDEIIAMALEAGTGLSCVAEPLEHPWKFSQAELERFAALVAAAEREACAKVCSDKALRCEAEAQRAIDNGEHDEVSAIRSAAWLINNCAAAIRQRGAT